MITNPKKILTTIATKRTINGTDNDKIVELTLITITLFLLNYDLNKLKISRSL